MEGFARFFIVTGWMQLFVGGVVLLQDGTSGVGAMGSGLVTVLGGSLLLVLVQIRDAVAQLAASQNDPKSTATVSAKLQAEGSTMLVYCPVCGDGSPELAVKCSGCGHRLAGSV